MRFLLRLLSLFALAAAVVMAVVDATRSIAASAWTYTPLVESWQATWPEALSGLQNVIEQKTLPALWDPVLVAVLSLPAWLVFAALALVLYALGYRRRRPGETFLATR